MIVIKYINYYLSLLEACFCKTIGTNPLINQNLEILKKTIYIFSFGCLITQLILSKNSLDYTSVFLIFLSNIFVTIYCFNNKNISDYPISSNIIFVSYFINIGGVLYFKTITTTLITDKLNLPLNTIVYLIIFHFVIIISHYFYKKLNVINEIRNNLSNFFLKKNLMTISNNNFLIFIGSIAIILKLSYYDLNTAIGEQTLNQYPSLFRDIIFGFMPFAYAPFLILFSKKLYNLDDKKNYNFIYVIFFITILFLSMSTGSRSLLFDLGLFIFFVFLIYVQKEYIKINKSFLFKMVIILLVSLPIMTVLDTISKAYLLDRSKNTLQSPIKNFTTTINRIMNYEQTKSDVKEIYELSDFFQSEEYYDNSIFNRFNILLVNDNFNYVLGYISLSKMNEIKKHEFNKIISIIPQPIINIFNKDFVKTDYLSVSMGSFIYRAYDQYSVGSLNIGSFPFAMMYYYKILWPIYLFLLSIFVFFVFDSFFHQKKKIISPIVFFLFYATSGGVLNIFTSSEISKLLALTIRNVPQTIILYFLLYKCYHYIFNKKIN